MRNPKSKGKIPLGSRRSSVIVLVVAVLALLAVIGTVYIVSSRAERSAAAAAQAGASLDNAQKSVNEVLKNIVGEPMYDGGGIVGGYIPLGPVGDHIARTFDIGEFNGVNPGYAFYNPSAHDQSWLVADLYRSAVGGNLYYNNLTFPQNRVSAGVAPNIFFSPSVYNPATSQYDINIYLLDGTGTPSNKVGLFNAVADPLPGSIPLPAGGTGVALPDAFVQLLPFSEANGVRYRYGLRILDTSRMANLNVGNAGAFDGVAYGALPVWLQNGTYPNGYLLANPAATFDSTGSMGAAADLANSLNVTAAGFGPGNSGRFGLFDYRTLLTNPLMPAPIDYISEQLMFHAEAPIRLVNSKSFWDNKLTAPFDLSDELALRAYGAVGTYAQSRAAIAGGQPIWPNTLGNLLNPPSANVSGNLRRNFYTNFSYSRDLRSLPDPATPYTLTGMNTNLPLPSSTPGYVWPPFPARVGINPDIAPYTRAFAPFLLDELALAATNIATAMEASGYTHAEACAFAANYLTYRWNSWTVIGTQIYKGNPVRVYSLPLGPSIIDDIGICLRANAAGSYGKDALGNSVPTDLHAEKLGKIYLGYAAQPFINEVATNVQDNMGTAQFTDWAIELYNPYNVALSLNDYRLNINGTDYDLGKDSGGAARNWWIPPRGYFVITQQNNDLSVTVTNADAQKKDDTNFGLTGAKRIYLTRKYILRDNVTAAWGAVDQYDVSALTSYTTASGDPPKKLFLARQNTDDGTAATLATRWIATVHTATAEAIHTNSGASPDRMSLGEKNDNDGSVTAALPLYDRVIDHDDPAWNCRVPLDNINDFNRIMRIASQIDTTATPAGAPVDDFTISQQLAARIADSTTNGAVMGTMFPAEAEIHFDFLTDPGLYSFPALPSLPNVVFPAVKPGDTRAVILLKYLTFADRVSDYTIDIGDSMTADRGIAKLRIPGQINVNTAPAEVLATIPVLGANQPVIGLIMAYRWRTNTNDARIPNVCRPVTMVDFSGFPGYGIRSLGELQLALIPAVSSPLTLADRDALWGSMYAMLTVRSDTFVVYAYLEAVRQNPRYGGAFDNSLIWYNNAAITDDPNDGTHALLRVARRRWVAIVDRSQSNFNRYMLTPGPNPVTVPEPRFTLPRIVAQKDLPN